MSTYLTATSVKGSTRLKCALVSLVRFQLNEVFTAHAHDTHLMENMIACANSLPQELTIRTSRTSLPCCKIFAERTHENVCIAFNENGPGLQLRSRTSMNSSYVR